VFPLNRLLLIFEAKEMVLFFFFFLAPDNPSIYRVKHDACTTIEENREEKENLCSISIDSFSIVFFFCLFFLAFLISFWMTNAHTHKQPFIFFFFLTWEPDLVYKGNISFFVLILSRGMHQPTLDQIFFIPSSSSG